MTKLNDIIKELRGEIGGDLVQLSVCGSDGMAISRETIITDNDMADQLSARVTMTLQTAKRITEKLKLGEYEETIYTFDKNYVFTKFLGDGSYAISCLLTKKATLGTVRMLIEEYSPKIWDAIPR
jgi:predicted regulator of Ras-like GTPase activity (Roadblock/LC7/MglB family)